MLCVYIESGFVSRSNYVYASANEHLCVAIIQINPNDGEGLFWNGKVINNISRNWIRVTFDY